MTDPLAQALNRFDVPPMSAGLADRIVARATALPAETRWSRDRRGAWRRGRQVLLGTAAVSLLSVAAVASGLLGRVGIEVPVLTAMLAPRPVPKPHPHVAPVRVAAKPAVAPVIAPPPPAVMPTMPTPAERMARRIERRERIVEFTQEHPRAAAIIKQRIVQQLRVREAERRSLLGFPPADPSAPDYRPLTDAERFILWQERRRDLRRVQAMIDRRLAAREARRAAAAPAANATDTPNEGSAPAPR